MRRNAFFKNWAALYAEEIWDSDTPPWKLFPADATSWVDPTQIKEHDEPCARSFLNAYKTTPKCKLCLSKDLYQACFNDPVIEKLVDTSIIPLSPVTLIKKPFFNSLFRELIYHSVDDLDDLNLYDGFESRSYADVTRLAYGVYFSDHIYASIDFFDVSNELKIVLY